MDLARPDSSKQFAQSSLVLSFLGLAAMIAFWMFLPEFWLVAGTALLSQGGAVALGIWGWRSKTGKVATVASATLFVLTAVFFSLVLLLALSIQYGAPM